MATTAQPLKGIRVVDASSIIYGPYAGQILGDYGAEVIKVEPPEGDSTRHTGPAVERGMASLFLSSNRNKRSVVLDLKQKNAREAMHAILASADVFIHNIRPQKLHALSLEPDLVRKLNPKIIYASLTGFGSNGPYAGKPAYDDIIQGLSGSAELMHQLTGKPTYMPTILADKVSAVIAANAILSALYARGQNGEGCEVEIPMFESMVAFTLIEHQYGRVFDPPKDQTGYPRVLTPSRKPFRTLDGYVCMLPYSTNQWKSFFAFCGVPHYAEDPRFSTMSARTENIQALYDIAAKYISERSTQEWLQACETLEIPAGPINTIDDVLGDEHLNHSGFFTSHNDPIMGTIKMPGVSATFDGVRPTIKLAPRLGEHTRQVLSDVGIASSLIDEIERHNTRT